MHRDVISARSDLEPRSSLFRRRLANSLLAHRVPSRAMAAAAAGNGGRGHGARQMANDLGKISFV